MNNINGLFVVGTDTEVGKTLVSGALIRKLRSQGKQAIGFKPVAAGTYRAANGDILNEDLETLRIASQLAPGQLKLCPYVLDIPAAPHLAAATTETTLKLGTIIEALIEVQKHSDYLIVEGAGGFLVPLNEKEDLGDLAQQMRLPIILVVGMKLGCINHALLTQEAIKARGLKMTGWIANSLLSEMSLLKENIASLQTRIDAPFLGFIPPLPNELIKSDNSPYSLEALDFAAQHIQIKSN